MKKVVSIYCEGKSGSYDFDILEKVIAGISLSGDSTIQIKPVGGKRGAGSIIDYLEQGVSKSTFKIFFRDRDFDFPIPDSPVLEQDPAKKYLYYGYRNTIENYLFDVAWFWEFLLESNNAERYSLKSETEVSQTFIKAAHRIRYYQAARHAMGKMRTNETDFGTKWIDKSGTLPVELDKDSCRREAFERIKDAKGHAEKWTEAEFDRVYEAFLTKFDDVFMDDLLFLVYFQGKDFARSLTDLLPEFPLKSYYKHAIKQFDYLKFPDLVALQALIERNLG